MHSAQLQHGSKKQQQKKQICTILSDVLEYFYLRLGHRISIQTEQQEDELTGLARKKKQTKQNQNMLNLLPSFINCVLLGVARGERARQTQS